MDEEKIRQAFSKAKKDILSLKLRLVEIHQEISELKRTLDRQSDSQTDRPTNLLYFMNHRRSTSTSTRLGST